MNLRILCVRLYLLLMVASSGSVSTAQEAEHIGDTPTLFLIGDSTVKNGSGQGDGGLFGWGQMISHYFDPAKITIENRARGGRSSRTYLTEGLWDAVLAEVQPGDWVMMQFGHNDGGPMDEGRARASMKGIGDDSLVVTNKDTGKVETVFSYGWYLRRYIADTQAKGAVPIVVSPVPRNIWRDGRVLRASHDYGKWARESAAAGRAVFLDLNELVAVRYEADGQERVASDYFTPADHTHTTSTGAEVNAEVVALGIRELGDPILAACLASTSATNLEDSPSGPYLFSYFTGNGEDGLQLAWSRDGYRWEALNDGRSYLAPQVGKSKLMRDPCMVLGPDGVFHMVWTTGWNEDNIGYAHSEDLVHWSKQQEIPVMREVEGVRNCWAPEIVYDTNRAEYLIIWASTIPGRFSKTAGSSESDYNHRIYFTTTKDFETFTPSQLFYDPGFSVIDATFLNANGHPYLIIKDETRHPPKKHLRIAAAKDLRGPFGELGPPFTRDWVEGPTALQVGEDYLVYFDAYRDHRYEAMRSRDLRSWEDVSGQLSFPSGARHGTVIQVPETAMGRLISHGREAGAVSKPRAAGPMPHDE